MADKDTSTEEATDTSKDGVETQDENLEADETTDNEVEGTDADDTESEDDDDSEDGDDSDDDDSEDEEEDSDFKKAFSNIKGETPEEYIPNLEEAYRKSSAEAKRLVSEKKDIQGNMDKITAAVAKDPELAKKINEIVGDDAESPLADPALLKARQDYNDEIANDFAEFQKEHSSFDFEDEEVAQEFFDNVKLIGSRERAKGRLIKPAAAYKKAWAMMDIDESEDKLVNAAKKTASKTKNASAKKVSKPESKKKLTDAQIAYGKKMGLTEKQLLATSEG